MAHALLAPSSLGRVALCPASLLASLHVPSRPSGPAAALGTHYHDQAEKILRDSHILWPPINLPDPIFTYVHYAYNMMQKADRYGIEARVPLDSFAPIAGQFGTADFWALEGTTVHVTDLKTGSIRVDPDCEQLWAYAAGVIYGELRNVWVDEVVLTIVQQNVIEVIKLTRAEFDERVQRLRKACFAALNPEPKFVPSEKACEYCPAAGVCLARAMEIAQLPALLDTSPSLMTMEQAEVAFSLKKKAEKYFKQLEETLLAHLSAGGKLANYEIGKTKPHRTWQSREAFLSKAQEIGLDILALMTPVSPSKLKEMLGAKPSKLFDDIVVQPEGEDKVVEVRLIK
jgi:hypothetical protein